MGLVVFRNYLETRPRDERPKDIAVKIFPPLEPTLWLKDKDIGVFLSSPTVKLPCLVLCVFLTPWKKIQRARRRF